MVAWVETMDFDENKLTNDSELQALDCGQRVYVLEGGREGRPGNLSTGRA